jgi:hypothetical protein
LSASVIYRSEFGLRDGHEKIHIISEHARAGQEDNPLEPIIQEAEADPDGKFILHPIDNLAEAENIFKNSVLLCL